MVFWHSDQNAKIYTSTVFETEILVENIPLGLSLPEKKNQGFNGIRTRDLRNTGAMLYQLSYEATHWERGQFL